MADICHHSVSLPVFSHPMVRRSEDGGREGNLFQFPPLSLLFCLFRFGAAGHSSVHAKGLLVLCLPIPNFSQEKSTSCLTARGRERGGGQSSLSLSLFEIFKSAADQTIPFANVHLVRAISSKFQPSPSIQDV